jgi:hypothetical protein
MALTQLIGESVGTPGTTALAGDQLRVTRLACLTTGIVDRLRVYSVSSGNVKAALTDTTGDPLVPDTVLSQNTGTAVSASQWNDVLITPVSVTEGILYGTVGLGDASGVVTFNSNSYGSNTLRYTAVSNPYSSGIPSSMPALSGIGEQLYQVIPWGYPLPSISSIDGDNDISVSQTGVTLSGLNLQDTGNAVLELCNNSDYASATVKVVQTWNSQTDTTLNFDVVQGALSTGTVYAFVTTSLGQRHVTGFSVTLSSGTGVSDTPLGGSFEISGVSLSAVSDIDDTPLTAEYDFSGLNIDANPGDMDNPGGGDFSLSGASIQSYSNAEDIPGVVGYSYSGHILNTVSSVEDIPAGKIYEFSGLLLDAEASTGITDTPLGGSFELSRLNIEAVQNIIDTPLVAEYVFSALSVSGSAGRMDVPLTASYLHAGILLSAVSECMDNASGAIFNFSGHNVDWHYVPDEDDVVWREPGRIEMKQIPFGNDSVALSFQTPAEWNVAMLTGVDVSVADKNGTEVLASTSCTLWPETSLGAAVDKYDDPFSIELASGATAPLAGDKLTIAGDESTETVIVKAYDSTDRTVTLEEAINHSYESGSIVLGNVVSYDLDVSDTDTFTAGKKFIATWTPAGTGTPLKTILQITKFSADTTNLELEFSDVYPRAYRAFTDPVNRFSRMVSIAQRQMEQELRSLLADYNRIVGEPVLKDLLMCKMAWIWVLNADDDLSDEREVINTEYSRLLTILKGMPVWTDTDQDGVEDEAATEVTSHTHVFQKGW